MGGGGSGRDPRARRGCDRRVVIDYDALPFVLDSGQALRPESPAVHPDHGSNILLDRTFVWGEVEQHFAQSPRQLSFRVTWGRSSTVPVETFGVVAAWDPWNELLDVWASIQMPKYADQIARAHACRQLRARCYDVDVGGSYEIGAASSTWWPGIWRAGSPARCG
jgi:2-furoyl-CoA dehydrogenase large subunit